jgi:hypothetical protein
VSRLLSLSRLIILSFTFEKTLAFLTVPMYSLFLGMRNQAPRRNREMVRTFIMCHFVLMGADSSLHFLIIGISCVGWVTNHFASVKFPNQSDITAAVG